MLPCEADQERHHAGPGHPPCHDVTTTITHNTIGNVVGDGASIVMELRLEERLAVAAPRHAWIWEQRSSWCAVASQGQVLLRGSAAAWHRVLPPLKTVLVG
jgi:hypothetical protein